MGMVCTVCGRVAEYNEKLNVYYCKEHGFTTWLQEEEDVHEIGGMKVNEEVALGGVHVH